MFTKLKELASQEAETRGEIPMTYVGDISRLLTIQPATDVTDAPEASVVPALQFEALAQIVYGLYLRIFEHATFLNDDGDGRDPDYITRRETGRLIDTGVKTLRGMADEVTRAWAQRMSEVDSDADYTNVVRDLPAIAARFGLTRSFPATIYHMVMAVYSNGDKIHWTAPEGTPVKIYLPGKLTGFSIVEWPIQQISSVNVPKRLPLFWRWMAILFHDQVIGQTVPKGSTLVGDFSLAYLALGQAARPIGITEWQICAQLGSLPRRTTANLVAALIIGSVIDGVTLPSNRQERSQRQVAKHLANSLMNTQCTWVDQEVATLFFSTLRQTHQSALSEDAYSLVIDDAQNCASYRNLSDLIWTAPASPESGRRNGPKRYFSALEAVDPEEDLEVDDKEDKKTDEKPKADEPTEEDEEDVADDDAIEIDDDLDEEPLEEDDPEAPSDEDKNNYMAHPDETGPSTSSALIALASDNEGIDTFIYRMAVLRASEEMELRPELGVSPETKAVLRDWCLRWLWLASVAMTKEVVSSLGLDRIFKTLISEE